MKNYVPDDTNTDEASVASHTCTSASQIEQEELYRKCRQCGGSGSDAEMQTDIACCGNYTEGGECCGFPTGVSSLRQIQCERCQATGFEKIDPAPQRILY